MTKSWRRFVRFVRPPSAMTAIVGLLGALFFSAAPTAQAFYIQNHELVTRNALPPDQVSGLAMAQILNGPPPGGGAIGSDSFATDQWRHLDNAKNPADVCARAQQAWNILSPVILTGSQPVGPGATVLANGPAARAAFGGLIHAQQDFYAHSNWVEDNVAAGQPDRLAPSIFPSCNPADFPADLHTGYFNILFSKQFPLDGCPPSGPPPGFQECHSAMNKDGPDTARGSQPAPGTGMTMYDVAVNLATSATTNVYGQIHSLVANTVTAKYPGVDGECIATKLFHPDLLGPCASFANPRFPGAAPPR